MVKVFISYRRDDSADFAGRIFDRLEREFRREELFLDVDRIPAGEDFGHILECGVAECDVLLALIGPGWFGADDLKSGRSRLHDADDVVRSEIETALQGGIAVIPVLLKGARMPRPEQLPETLRALVNRHGCDVGEASFRADMDVLVRALRGIDASKGEEPVNASPAKRMGGDGGVHVEPKIVHGAPNGRFRPGAGRTEWFKDHKYGLVLGACKLLPKAPIGVQKPRQNSGSGLQFFPIKSAGTAPNPADVEDGLDQVGNLESAVEPMPTFTSVNPAPCRVGPPHLGFYRSGSRQSNQKRRLSADVTVPVAHRYND
jgi:TIR domain